LTAIAVLGTWIDLFAIFWASPNGIAGGCGGGSTGFAVLLLAVVGVGLLFVSLVALTGSLLMWFKPEWGPPLVIFANLLAMGFDAWWRPANAGQLTEGLILVALAVVPALAILVTLRPLLTIGSVTVRIVEAAALGAVAVPILWLYVYGMSSDLSLAFQQLPPAAVAAACRGGG
jgi:hypothetical protein